MIYLLLAKLAVDVVSIVSDLTHLSVLNNGSPSEPSRSGRRARRARKRSLFFKPCLEGLEERWVPDAISWVGGTRGNATDWGTATNWSKGFVPGRLDDVTIGQTQNNPVISAAAFAASITINTGGDLTVNAQLTVGGIFTVNGGLGVFAEVITTQIQNNWRMEMGNGATIAGSVSNAANANLSTDISVNTINAALDNAGEIDIGGSSQKPGNLNVKGNFTQAGTGTLTMYSSGNITFSILNVGGTATLAGTLAMASDGTANPARTWTVSPVTAGTVAGTFGNTTVKWGQYTWYFIYGATDVKLYVSPLVLYPQQTDFYVVAGQQSEAEWLASFEDQLPLADYAVSINWGDQPGGDVTAGWDTGPDGNYQDDAWGQHTFAQVGDYTVTVTVTDTVSNVSASTQMTFHSQSGNAPRRLSAVAGKTTVAAAPSAVLPLSPANSGSAVPAGGSGALTVSGAVSAAPFIPGLAPPAATVPAADAAAVDAALVAAVSDLNLWPADAGLRALPRDAYFAGLAE